MGQKANPNGMRLSIVRNWQSRYFAMNRKQLAEWVVQDKKIRKYFDNYYKKWGLSRIEIERTEVLLKVIIFTVKPGMVFGQEGKNIKKINEDIQKIVRNRDIKINTEVQEVEKPDWDATIIANEIAIALEKRTPFRIAQKRVIKRVMRSGAKGIKTQVSGRLNGVDMARTEGYLEGEVPLQTLRNDIDYASVKAKTSYGVLGVKVWISRGEVLKGQQKPHQNSRSSVNRKRNEFTEKRVRER